MRLSDYLKGVFEVDRDANALEYDHEWHTWGELGHSIKAVNDALDTSGLGADTGVAILLRNHPAHYAAIMAMFISERCIVTINPMQPLDRVKSDLKRLRMPAIIAETEDWNASGLRDLAREIGSVAIELTGDKTNPVKFVEGCENLGSGDHHAPLEGIAIQMLTSGTTGTPKRVPLKRKHFEKAMAGAMVYERDRNEGDPPKLRSGVQLLQTPFVHIGGIFGAANVTLAGRQMCLLEKFTVESWHDAVKRHRPKVAGGPPTALRMILDADLPKDDLSSLVALRAGTAPLAPEMVDEFLDRYGIPVLENYGATEFAGGVAGWSLGDFKNHWSEKRGSVGRVQDHIDARVVDQEDFSELPIGEVGLLEIKGSQIGDGKSWVRTTDLAQLDEDRFLYILGRADNAIIRGGFKVMPGDVVKALEAHPSIREASVVALEDRRLGQVPVAAMILKRGARPPSDEELGNWIRERMTAYSVPTAYKFVEELPRTPSLKVSAPDVKALFEGMRFSVAQNR